MGEAVEKEHLSTLLIAPHKFSINSHIDHKLLLREQFMVPRRKSISWNIWMVATGAIELLKQVTEI